MRTLIYLARTGIKLSVLYVYLENFGRVRLGYPGIYSEMEIQLFRNENSSQRNAYLHYSNYSYPGLIPNESALSFIVETWRLISRIARMKMLSCPLCRTNSKLRHI